MGYIYKITNTVNNKKYIGKTKYTVKSRYRRHCYEAKRNVIEYPLYSAMRKYGIDKFIVETIEEINNDDLLNEREKYWIQYYDTYIKHGKGYNCTLGGEGNTTIDLNKIYELWDLGLSVQEISNITEHNRSNIRKILQSYNNYSVEVALNRGRVYQTRALFNPVDQYDIYGNYIQTFISEKEASQITGISYKSLNQAIIGKSKTAGGFQWKKHDDDNQLSTVQNLYCNKSIYQIDKNTNQIIATYKNAAEASRATNISSICIRNVCHNKSQTAGGYIWKYVE